MGTVGNHEELRLTALGEAIGIVASVASRCEKEELATVKEAGRWLGQTNTNQPTINLGLNMLEML